MRIEFIYFFFYFIYQANESGFPLYPSTGDRFKAGDQLRFPSTSGK